MALLTGHSNQLAAQALLPPVRPHGKQYRGKALGAVSRSDAWVASRLEMHRWVKAILGQKARVPSKHWAKMGWSVSMLWPILANPQIMSM